jgi:3-methylcrotonyl-CoA carboxylase alpha subunit
MIKRLLIANRGEIACRIIASAKKLSIETLAVYSEPDAHAQHVLRADSAYPLGGKTAAESYLNRDTIIEIALRNRADAIHPGYGFLAEDPEFSRAVAKAGLIFVGPTGENIELMGNKESAKACAQEAKLPIAKDYRGDVNDKAKLTQAADEIGFPLLVKASAGGGGKGMRLVQSKEELQSAIEAAAREAEASFGNAAVFLEQYIRPARHIEVQIARDNHGNCVHLHTRDCSIQRRHQKVIEEAPANIPTDVEKAMCSASIQLASHIGYTGLGTLEFLLDENNGFYFMEMNTRLQVEHPVTEMITGLDCVELQLEIASGNELPVKQTDIRCNGHAIEARICAEAPLCDFMPSTGTLAVFKTPTGIRFDTGVIEGDEISAFYDSMIAKAISYAPTRAEATESLCQALSQTHIVGPETNVEFIHAILRTTAFSNEDISTEFIDLHLAELGKWLSDLSRDEVMACALANLKHSSKLEKPPCSDDIFSPWASRDSWRPFGNKSTEKTLTINSADYRTAPSTNKELRFSAYSNDGSLHVFMQGKKLRVTTAMEHGCSSESASNQSALSTPMPGTVTQVLVKEGDSVEAGQTVVCIEAMKMEHSVKAPQAGSVRAIHVAVNDTTQENQVLIELDYETE